MSIFFINEITASDAGPDIIRSHLFSVKSNTHMTLVRIYGDPYAHKFCTVDILWNITRRQAISPVAKFHHLLGHGFMIQRVIMIFIKCLSANQNQLFYKKV